MRSEGAHMWHSFWIGLFQPFVTRISGAFDCDHIVDGVYLGDVGSAANLKALKDDLGITHIITAVLGLRSFFPSEFVYLHVPLRDLPEENIIQHFDESTRFIEEALKGGGKVFVHCMKGASRSASLVMAWLIASKGMATQEALEYMRQRRPVVGPNEGFMEQLQQYEKEQRLVPTLKTRNLHNDGENHNNNDNNDNNNNNNNSHESGAVETPVSPRTKQTIESGYYL